MVPIAPSQTSTLVPRRASTPAAPRGTSSKAASPSPASRLGVIGARFINPDSLTLAYLRSALCRVRRAGVPWHGPGTETGQPACYQGIPSCRQHQAESVRQDYGAAPRRDADAAQNGVAIVRQSCRTRLSCDHKPAFERLWLGPDVVRANAQHTGSASLTLAR